MPTDIFPRMAPAAPAPSRYPARAGGIAATGARMLDSRWYHTLDQLAKLMVLNLLWALSSLPLITVVPATAALFAVVRDRTRSDDPVVWRAFVRHFRANLRSGLALQALLTVVGAALMADLYVAKLLPPVAEAVLTTLTLAASIIVLAASVYAIPLMVTYHLTLRRLLRLSLLFAVGRPMRTVGNILLVTFALALTYVFPLAPILVAGLLATALYKSSARVFASVGPTEEAVR